MTRADIYGRRANDRRPFAARKNLHAKRLSLCSMHGPWEWMTSFIFSPWQHGTPWLVIYENENNVHRTVSTRGCPASDFTNLYSKLCYPNTLIQGVWFVPNLENIFAAIDRLVHRVSRRGNKCTNIRCKACLKSSICRRSNDRIFKQYTCNPVRWIRKIEIIQLVYDSLVGEVIDRISLRKFHIVSCNIRL